MFKPGTRDVIVIARDGGLVETIESASPSSHRFCTTTTLSLSIFGVTVDQVMALGNIRSIFYDSVSQMHVFAFGSDAANAVSYPALIVPMNPVRRVIPPGRRCH